MSRYAEKGHVFQSLPLMGMGMSWEINLQNKYVTGEILTQRKGTCIHIPICVDTKIFKQYEYKKIQT